MSDMTKDDLKKRTKALALRVIGLTNSLPDTYAGKVIANQLLRCRQLSAQIIVRRCEHVLREILSTRSALFLKKPTNLRTEWN